MSILDDDPQGDQTTQIFGGIIATLPFVVYGLMCIINRAGAVPGKDNYSTPLFGMDAVILGITCLSFASILHFHYYWGLSESENLRDNCKTCSIVILIASLGWVTWCLLRGFGQLY